MNRLFVAMQDHATRRWTPVARLTRKGGQNRFVYTQGCRSLAEFEPFGRMTQLEAEYVSDALFPLFSNRVLARARPEYERYMQWLGLTGSARDVMEELGRTGGVRATDGLELIPCPEPTADGRFEVCFFARGLRHLSESYRAAINDLAAGNRLYLMRDIQNPHDALALMLRTADPVRIVGYIPRHYADDVSRLLDRVGPGAVEVLVDAINQDAPLQYRLRCRLSAPWPAGFASCDAPEFQPLAGEGRRVLRLNLPSPGDNGLHRAA